jgi:hypothetical protein
MAVLVLKRNKVLGGRRFVIEAEDFFPQGSLPIIHPERTLLYVLTLSLLVVCIG